MGLVSAYDHQRVEVVGVVFDVQASSRCRHQAMTVPVRGRAVKRLWRLLVVPIGSPEFVRSGDSSIVLVLGPTMVTLPALPAHLCARRNESGRSTCRSM